MSWFWKLPATTLGSLPALSIAASPSAAVCARLAWYTGSALRASRSGVTAMHLPDAPVAGSTTKSMSQNLPRFSQSAWRCQGLSFFHTHLARAASQTLPSWQSVDTAAAAPASGIWSHMLVAALYTNL